MTWLLQLLNFVNENGEILGENICVFLIWTVLIIAITCAIYSFYEKRIKKKYDELKIKYDALQEEYAALKDKYNQMDISTRLKLGTKNFPQTSAKAISKDINKKY